MASVSRTQAFCNWHQALRVAPSDTHGFASTTCTKVKAVLGAIGVHGCLYFSLKKSRSSQCRMNSFHQHSKKLPFAFDIRLNQNPEDWHQAVVRFRRANGIRDGCSRLFCGEEIEKISTMIGMLSIVAQFIFHKLLEWSWSMKNHQWKKCGDDISARYRMVFRRDQAVFK